VIFLYLFIDPIQRKSIMDGDHIIYLLSMLSGEFMDLKV